MTQPAIRPRTEEDVDDVVDLAVRAWTPVFASMRATLGDALFLRFWPDWERDQATAVRDAITTHDTWVTDWDDEVVGFVTVVFDEAGRSGDIHMIAVDPDRQLRGIARDLTDFAIAEMRRRGLTLATVSTGGDPGHAPARHTYESAGFTAFPQVLYARLIEPGPDAGDVGRE